MKISVITNPGSNFPNLHTMPSFLKDLPPIAKEKLRHVSNNKVKSKYINNWFTPFQIIDQLKHPDPYYSGGDIPVSVLYNPTDEQVYIIDRPRVFDSKQEYLLALFAHLAQR